VPVQPRNSTSTERPATTERKRAILDAALDCFIQFGIEATTIQDIQRNADCSVGSLYHHFGSKEGIAEELFIQGVSNLNRTMLKRLAKAGNGQESATAVVHCYCDWTCRNVKLARYLHSRDIDFSPEARNRLKDIHRDYINSVFRWFAPFVANGEMRVLPADTYVPLISGPIQAYIRRWLAGEAGNPKRVKDLFAEAAWNAVKCGP